MNTLKCLFFLFFLSSMQVITAQNEFPKEKKHALKFNVIAPFKNHFVFIYEHNIKTYKTLEGSLGIIGVGMQYQSTSNKYPSTYAAQGLFLKLAYKNILKKRRNPGKPALSGTYLKYEIGYTRFKEQISEYIYTYFIPYNSFMLYQESENNVQAFSMMVLIGQQFVIKNTTLVNFYGGFGSIFDNRPIDFYYDYYKNDYIGKHLNYSGRFSVDFGMSIGFLF